MLKALSLAAALVVAGAAQAQPAATPPSPSFDYDTSQPLDLTLGPASKLAGGIVAHSVSFKSGDHVVTGELVEGKGDVRHPAILFVHWLGDPKTTNHTEFEADAAAFAQLGITSLLIDAPWSKDPWFESMGKSADADIAFTNATVVDLRRSLDVLVSLPRVDKDRIGFVGHDFGAMFGLLMASVDHRPNAWVFMTPNSSLGEWYLWQKKAPDRDAYMARLAMFDLAPFAAKLSAPGGAEFEFSMHDEYVTHDHAQALFDAAPQPKDIQWFNAGHALDEGAASSRNVWLESRIIEPPDRRF